MDDRFIRKSYVRMGNRSRKLAFSIIFVSVIGIGVGSILPEFGNYVAKYIIQTNSHALNICFLILGIIGIVLSLLIGYRKSRP